MQSKNKNSKSICFFSHSGELAGGERAMLDCIDALAESDFNCHVILPQKGPMEEEIKNRHISYSVINFPWATKQEIITDKYSSLSSIIAELEKINPTIICTNTSVIDIGAMSALILNKPHIWFIHEFGLKEYGIIFDETLKKRCEFMDLSSEKVVVNSKSLFTYYSKYFSKNKIEALYPPVEHFIAKQHAQNYFSNKNSLKLLILGSIQEGKRQEDAVNALAELKNKKIELLIVGNSVPEYKEYLAKLVLEHDLLNVKFLDFTNAPREVIKSCDVLINCSPMEAFGKVTIEAMILKKGVIGARSGGNLELIQDYKTGLLYNPKDSHDLAKKIEYFYTNKNKILEFGKNAFNLNKEKFSKLNYKKKLLKIINGMNLGKNQSSISVAKEKKLVEIIYEQSKIIKDAKHQMIIQNEIRNKMQNELQNIKNTYSYKLSHQKKWYISYPKKICFSMLKTVIKTKK